MFIVLKNMRSFILLIVFSLLTVVIYAQPGEPGEDPGNGEPNTPTGAVPVDGGLGILLAAGIGYGAKKAHAYRKKLKVKS
jgi:hypothetical protein